MSEAAVETTATNSQVETGADAAVTEEDGKGSKSAVLADLARERKARQTLEGQVAELAPLKDQMAALAAALGVKPDVTEGDALTQVQEQLAAMQRESSVLRLANEHRITDQHDLELLATAKDADSMKRLAERLAPSDEQHDATSRTRPKSDRSQGSDSSRDKQSGGRSVAQVMADRAAERAAKK